MLFNDYIANNRKEIQLSLDDKQTIKLQELLIEDFPELAGIEVQLCNYWFILSIVPYICILDNTKSYLDIAITDKPGIMALNGESKSAKYLYQLFMDNFLDALKPGYFFNQTINLNLLNLI